jgi:hypothetical protein
MEKRRVYIQRIKGVKKMSEPITEIDVELWLGSDVKKSELIEIITMVATGEYPRENLVRDISDYHHTEYEEIDWDTFDKRKDK